MSGVELEAIIARLDADETELARARARPAVAPGARPRCVRCSKALAPVFADPATRSGVLGYGFGAKGHFCTMTCGWWWAEKQLGGMDGVE